MMPDKLKIYEDATMKNISENPNGTRMDVIYLAMSEYAKEVAIGFEDWAKKNYHFDKIRGYYSVFHDGSHGKSHILPKFYTTEQLFDQYLTHLQKTNQ